MSEPLTVHDDREVFCHRLGHYLRFRYCRTTEGGPCTKILDCWFRSFDVVDFMRRHLTDEELMAVPPEAETEVASMAGLVGKARRAQRGALGA
jgi:hypothetical protein